MKTKYSALFVLITLSSQLFGQASTRKLPSTINHPSINTSAPFINLDGNKLVYLSDYTEDSKPAIFQSNRADGVNWSEGKMLPRQINNALSFQKGYTLSPDGRIFYMSISRSTGLGGFDIYQSEQRGSVWTEPVNIGVPFNSKMHDASPTFSTDGNAVYFMRCEKMSFEKAEGCRLLFSRKKQNGTWGEPEELPSYINTGNSQSPRIMGDGQSLIFSSDKLSPNQGGMDLYLTRRDGSSWTEPQPLTFVNSAGDDQFVSATSLGRYLMIDMPGTRKREIVEVLFPSELKPKATLKIEGSVNTPACYVSVMDIATQKKVYEGKPRNNQFVVYLNEGSRYELAVDPEQDNVTFFSRVIDLAQNKIAQVERVNVSLGAASEGQNLELPVIFYDDSLSITPAAEVSLRRLARFIKANPGKRFTVTVKSTATPGTSTPEPVVSDSLALSDSTSQNTVQAPVASVPSIEQQRISQIVTYLTKLGIDNSKFETAIVEVDEKPSSIITLTVM